MKRILVYCHSLKNSGGTYVTRMICNELMRQGFTVEFLIVRPEIGSMMSDWSDKVWFFDGLVIKRPRYNNKPNILARLKYRFKKLLGRTISVPYRKLQAHFNRYDIVYATNIYSHIEILKLVPSKKSVLHVHNSIEDLLFNRNIGLTKEHFKAFKTIIVLNEKIREEVIKHNLFDKLRVKVISNPVDKKALLEGKENAITYTKPTFVFIGSLTNRKRPWIFVEIARRFVGKAEFLMLGVGPLADNLINSDLPNNLAMLGFSDEPAKYLANARGLILTSSHEGAPIVISEAQFLGVRVFSVDCPTGPREQLAEHDALIEFFPDESEVIDSFVQEIQKDLDGVLQPTVQSTGPENELKIIWELVN